MGRTGRRDWRFSPSRGPPPARFRSSGQTFYMNPNRGLQPAGYSALTRCRGSGAAPHILNPSHRRQPARFRGLCATPIRVRTIAQADAVGGAMQPNRIRPTNPVVKTGEGGTRPAGD